MDEITAAGALVGTARGIVTMRRQLAITAPREADRESVASGFEPLGDDAGLSEQPVIPVIYKDEPSAALTARRLRDLGILATPVLFPAGAQGSPRFRLCVTAGHTREQLEFALDVFGKLAS